MTSGDLVSCLQRRREGMQLGRVWQRRRRRKCEKLMDGGLVKNWIWAAVHAHSSPLHLLCLPYEQDMHYALASLRLLD